MIIIIIIIIIIVIIAEMTVSTWLPHRGKAQMACNLLLPHDDNIPNKLRNSVYFSAINMVNNVMVKLVWSGIL